MLVVKIPFDAWRALLENTSGDATAAAALQRSRSSPTRFNHTHTKPDPFMAIGINDIFCGCNNLPRPSKFHVCNQFSQSHKFFLNTCHHHDRSTITETRPTLAITPFYSEGRERSLAHLKINIVFGHLWWNRFAIKKRQKIVKKRKLSENWYAWDDGDNTRCPFWSPQIHKEKKAQIFWT